jgi:IS5 family transposase
MEAKRKTEEVHKDDDKPQPPSNKGTLIVDASCSPSQIKYPRDVELLNEALEKLEKIVDVLHTPEDGKKVRMYRQIARKQYLSIARSKKNSAKKIRKAVRQQLQYISRNQKIVTKLRQDGRELAEKNERQLETITKLYEQQKHMCDYKVNSVSQRIVNLRHPYLQPIVRGKAKAPPQILWQN